MTFLRRLTVLGVTFAALFFVCGCGGYGACEFWGTAGSGEDFYYCWQGEEREFCESAEGPGLNVAFHENKQCKAIGYENHCTDEEVAPGIEDKWTAAAACSEAEPPVGREPGSGTGEGECLVGTWDTDPNPTCLDQFSTYTLRSDGSAITYTPECTGQCNKQDNFVEFTWTSDSEFSGTLTLTYGRTVTCGQERNLPEQTVSTAFTCNETTAVVDGVTWHRK
ncbi:MAG: hypothetical protein P1V51_23315 [Deltaproteobacteria bacterium]|nr:hypothetical protein [Deltaproteobacteria bacterium]